MKLLKHKRAGIAILSVLVIGVLFALKVKLDLKANRYYREEGRALKANTNYRATGRARMIALGGMYPARQTRPGPGPCSLHRGEGSRSGGCQQG